MKEVRKPSLELIPRVDINLDMTDLYGIEIGCGVGLHPILWSKKNSEKKYLAIEHTAMKFDKFYRRFKNHNLPNLIPCHANAISVFAHSIEKESVQEINLLYPNPNPKRLNQRWHAMPIMWKILESLKIGGTITMATNERFYYEEAKDYFLNFWKLDLIEDKQMDLSNTKNFRTHFEKKYIEDGQTCYNTIWQKKSET